MRTKKPSLEVAAAVNEAAKKVGGLYVFSFLEPKILNEENASAVISKFPFANYECSGCTTKFAALAAWNPYCPSCGDRSVKRTGTVKAQTIHKDDELGSLTCRGCHAINVYHDSVVKAGKGDLHCAACGTQMAAAIVKADDAEGEDTAAEDMPEVNVDASSTKGKGKSTAGKKAAKAADATNEAPGPDVEAPEGSKEEPKGKVVQEGTVAQGEEDEKSEDKSGEADKSEDESGDESDKSEDESGEADESEEKADGADEGVPSASQEEGEEVEMTDMVDDDNLADIAVVSNAKVIRLHSGPFAFAQLTKENAGHNADIFGTEGFLRAIQASLAQNKIRKTMSAFNFQPIKLKLKLDKHIAKKIAEGLAKEAAALKADRKGMVANFKNAIDIAATGLNKGFWKDVANPLKDVFVKELSGMGIKGADKKVSMIFDKVGLQYTAALLKQANVIASKTPDGRKELAGLLDMTNTLTAGEDDSEEESDEVSALEPLGETETAALIHRVQRNTQTATAGKTVIAELAAEGLGLN